MTRRNYSSTAQATTLSAGCTNVATTMLVTAVTGWPASTPYTLIVDPDTVNEEVVTVTSRAGTTLTVTRAVGGTSGVAHSSGAVVRHGTYSADYDEPNSFLNLGGTIGGGVTVATGGLTVTAGGLAVTAGVETLPLGAVGTPSLTFAGDTNTGIYSPTADNIALTTGGTQRLNIDSAGLVSGTGTSYGAGTSYTPAAASSTWALGNGTSGGRYIKVGRTVHCRGFVAFGSTSTFPTTTWGVNLPVAAATANPTFPTTAYLSTGLQPITGQVFGWDTSPGQLHRMTAFMLTDGIAAWFGVDTATVGVFGTASGTLPFTWATGDHFAWSFTYESAS